MQSYYEQSTGKLVIEWYDKKKGTSSPVHHYFAGVPTSLQLHPKDPKNVVRATFTGTYGNMPGWIEKYCDEHHFQCQQVIRDKEVGWWFANWRVHPSGMKPLTSPTILGAVHQMVQLVPEVCEDLREKLIDNKEVIGQNLRNYPNLYQPLGVYFRTEEIKGEGGVMLIEEDIISNQQDGESDEDYLRRIQLDGKLERLVFELITPLPEPVREEESELMEVQFLDDEELTFDLIDIDEESVEGQEEVFHGLELEDLPEGEIELEGLEFIDDGSLNEQETIQVSAHEGIPQLSEDIEELSLKDHELEADYHASIDLEHEVVEDKFVKVQNTIVEPIPETESFPSNMDDKHGFELHVIESRDKKSGAVEGQWALF